MKKFNVETAVGTFLVAGFLCFAYLAIAWGQTERAARLLGAAQHARHQLNALSTEPQEIADFEQSLAQLTGALGEERRDKLMTDGAKMSLDEAVTLALEEKL